MLAAIVDIFTGTPAWTIVLGVYLARRGVGRLRHDASLVAKAALLAPFAGGGVLYALLVHDGDVAASMMSWLAGLAVGGTVDGVQRAACRSRRLPLA